MVMSRMTSLRLSVVFLCVAIGLPTVLHAVDFGVLKSGVVKVVSTFDNGTRKIGTGFVIRLEKDVAYVMTASHVVEEKDVNQVLQ